MTFLEFLLELMITLMFMTGAGVFNDGMDGLHIPEGAMHRYHNILMSHFSTFNEGVIVCSL